MAISTTGITRREFIKYSGIVGGTIFIGNQGGSISVKGEVNENSYSVSNGEEFYISGSKKDGKMFVKVLDFTKMGSDFLFGSLLNTETVGYIFALQVLPTIIFFSASIILF